ncbi:hypothetical protein [Nocardia sp. R7R-8]|uniref:hypothetical protein n=1 Tax=Nocardia sp. R7R-8 TaxID=3459304 RepID=UPI00403E2EB2
MPDDIVGRPPACRFVEYVSHGADPIVVVQVGRATSSLSVCHVAADPRRPLTKPSRTEMKLALRGVSVVCPLSVSAVAATFVVTHARAHAPRGAAKGYFADLSPRRTNRGRRHDRGAARPGLRGVPGIGGGTSEDGIVVQVSAHQSVDEAAAVVVAAERNLC